MSYCAGRPVKILAIALLLSLVAGCAPPPDGIVNFGLAARPVTLDPRFATDAVSARLNRLIYRHLVDFDDVYQPIPALASWEKLADRHYRFHLQEHGRDFHNGAHLTAADVKATYDYVLDEHNASPHRGTLGTVERVAVVDDDTVDFFLSEPDLIFPGQLVIGIVPANLIVAGHAFNKQPVGSGPFRFVDWPEEGRLTLQRVRDGQAFRFLYVPDPTVRVLKLLRGELDVIQNDLPPELVRYLAQQDDVTVVRGNGASFSYLGFNLQDPDVGRLEVRQAIAHALDRQAIITYVLGDAARPASALLVPDHWAGHPGLLGYAYDPALSRRLLHDAGYGNERPLALTYKTSSDPFRIRLATIIQSQLADAGIRVALRSYDWGTFYGDIKSGRFQMYSLSWVGIKTPDIFRYVFHSQSVPPGGANRGHLADAGVDGLIEAAETAADTASQAADYRKLQELLYQRLPYVPLWYEDHIVVTRRQVTGYRLAADGNYDGLERVKLTR
ncbi:MAG: extracellular solute-binding protein [Gammaproteobacteria bacterium]|nr:MAG: extracellular solute-binding protein [Gammaproteobacteria bacterium]TND07012.1 MAG: extracellular solute-binding protein [Gammaproteobacteria bacterium]